MSDTPETDAAWNAAPTDDTEFANAGWEFARELERERDEARQKAVAAMNDAESAILKLHRAEEELQRLRAMYGKTPVNWKPI